MDLQRSERTGTTGRRRALSGLASGVAALVFSRGVETQAAKKHRKKKRCPDCPQAAPCPQPNTCPERSCCVCTETSPTPGCQLGPPANSLTVRAVCADICGGADAFQLAITSAPGVSAACALNTTGPTSGCTAVRCPR
jgi:hypothetical protein